VTPVPDHNALRRMAHAAQVAKDRKVAEERNAIAQAKAQQDQKTREEWQAGRSQLQPPRRKP